MTRGLVSRGASLVLLAGGAGLAWLGSAQAWWRASGGPREVVLTGQQASGGLTHALAAVAAAGLLLVLVLQTPGRRVLAALLALLGAGMVAAAAYRFRPTEEAVLARLRESGLVDQVSVGGTAWPLLYGVAGALQVAGAAAVLISAAHWPRRTDRFARIPGRGAAAPAPGDDTLLAWRALDAGVDPTLADGPASGTTPDVQSTSARDTMGDAYDKKGFVNPTERRTS